MANSDLVLEENDNGYFVNGIQISIETYYSLLNDVEEDVEEIDEEDCDECEFCEDVNEIIEFIKNKDREVAHEYLSEVLDEYYTMGRQEVLNSIIDACEDELDDIEELED